MIDRLNAKCMLCAMTKTKRKHATLNEVAAFQAQWGSYVQFRDDLNEAGLEVSEATVQSWRLRNKMPADHDWVIGELAHKRGFFKTHYAALRAIHEMRVAIAARAGAENG